METRVAVMSIIVENHNSVERINALLHEYGEHIIGRMGLPYRRRGISIISVALDAPQNTLSSLSGKIGGLTALALKLHTRELSTMTERLISLCDRLAKEHRLEKDEYRELIENRSEELALYLASLARDVRHRVYGNAVYIRGDRKSVV